MSGVRQLAKQRSYSVRDQLPIGSRVAAVVGFRYVWDYAAGTEGTLESYTNAGFIGIIAHVRLDDGTSVQLSAGYLAPAQAPQ